MADGEAYVGKGDANGSGTRCQQWRLMSIAKIGIAQNPGPVLDEIGEALRALAFNAHLSRAPNA